MSDKGTSIVEFVVIMFIVVVVVIVVAALVAPVINKRLCDDGNKHVCPLVTGTPDLSVHCSWEPSTFECRDFEFQKCINSEKYSREDCIRLVGGNSGSK